MEQQLILKKDYLSDLLNKYIVIYFEYMKEYINHPFVKFLMVLVGIIAVAVTVWVVFEVIEEINDNRLGRDSDSWEYEQKSFDSNRKEASYQ